ncbi:DMT family transporter [Candidatus Korarchaeum cryptofilum]|uniref:Permease of the drug/metabolite transporter (DMT) superfamily n=1 Tax=Korarchaeum cryptofilum (strain OPF8) TaxID=374847 RepID=B1L462_KORCO|nr:DMT family transporter [Candidatus Korarchaeum cryptofilum]ACB07241.1 permease of the drug/metabolite transporter (DMT) superfamily [Candidatus Korarchaeum cryptofilum OPF8]
MNRMGAGEWGLLIILSVLWGASFLFMGILVKELPPLTISASRLTIASLLIGILASRRPKNLPWRELLILGVLNNTIPYALILWGQRYVSSSVASIINSTSPFFTSIFAHFLTDDEKINKFSMMGISLGFSGVLAMAWDSAQGSLIGELAIITAVICYSYATVYGRRFYSMGLSPLDIAFGQLSTAAATSIPLAILERPWLAMPSQRAWVSIIGISVFSTALAYLIFFRILERAGATNANLVTLLIPVTATLLCTAFLGERLELRHIVGMCLIMTGLLIMNLRGEL